MAVFIFVIFLLIVNFRPEGVTLWFSLVCVVFVF